MYKWTTREQRRSYKYLLVFYTYLVLRQQWLPLTLMTHKVTPPLLSPPLCLSFRTLLSVLFIHFVSLSSLLYLSFTLCPLPPTDPCILQQWSQGLGGGGGCGEEGGGKWMSIPAVSEVTRHRGAIDGSPGPHSLLMLECVILWRFSHTEMGRAEFP